MGRLQVGDRFETLTMTLPLCCINFFNMFKIFATTLRTWPHMGGNYESLATVSRLLCDPLAIPVASCRNTVAVQWDRDFTISDSISQDILLQYFHVNIQSDGALLFVCLFSCFTSQVNSYGHCGTVSSLNHTFSWAGLNKRLTSNLCTYFRL